MKTLLIATHNKAKLTELRIGVKTLVKKGITVVSLRDIHITDDPAETGTNFEENSKLKAVYYGNKTGIATIADDGGLIIPYLNNEPGIKSKRWMGRDASDQELIDFALLKLHDAKGSDRTAFLKTCLTFYNPRTKNIHHAVSAIKGHIADIASTKPTDGYPYRALFVVDQYGKYYDELTETEHIAVNHRLKALSELISKIERDLLQS